MAGDVSSDAGQAAASGTRRLERARGGAGGHTRLMGTRDGSAQQPRAPSCSCSGQS